VSLTIAVLGLRKRLVFRVLHRLYSGSSYMPRINVKVLDSLSVGEAYRLSLQMGGVLVTVLVLGIDACSQHFSSHTDLQAIEIKSS
jgi:hypothetical protein